MTKRCSTKNPGKTNPARVVMTSGDVNPEYGSTVVFRDKSGVHVERWDGPDDEDDFKRATVEVSGFDVPDDVFAYHSWAKPGDIASTHGQDVDDVRRAGKSRKIADRVWVLEMIGQHYGWVNLDGYPMSLTGAQIMQRWGNTFTRRGRKTGRSPKRGARGRFA